MAFVADEQMKELLRRQAMLEGTNPEMKIAEYERTMANLQATQAARPSEFMTTGQGRTEAELRALQSQPQRWGASGSGLPTPTPGWQDVMGGFTAESVPLNAPEAPKLTPAPPEMGGPPTAMIRGGPVDPPPPIDEDALRAAEWKLWDEQTAARQWQAQKTIEQIKEETGFKADPAYRYQAPPDPDAGRPEAFRGKHFRGGRQYTPNRGKGVGDAAARAKARGETGTFSPGRMAPPLGASWEYVSQTETPALQRLWQQNKEKQLGFDLQEAGLAQEQARAGILLAEANEAGLPYEQRIKRQFEGLMAMHDAMKERMLPNIQEKVDRQMALLGTDPEGMKQIDTPAKRKAVEAVLFKRYQQETFTNMMNIIIQLVMAQDPSGAARVAQEQARQAMFGGGAGAMPPTPTTP